ncbi:MAG: LacI family DNA-binding transcriptional regulator [Actinomycetota bacterium]|nr:LacI family DNA-binding transcriptional regulator [Actinomycetota bacterium]
MAEEPSERATLWAVARRAGVHAATASRALNEATRPLVAPDTIARVLRAARDLNYHPNHAARSLRTQRSMTIGVVIPDITNSLFPPIVRGIEDFLAPAGYVALVANTGRDVDRERVVMREMLARSVEGIVLATARRDYPLLEEPPLRGLPVVLVNRVTDDALFSSVSTDDRLGARLAVAHLLDLGHRRIAHIAGPDSLSTGFGRKSGYLEGMRSAGVSAPASLLVAADSYAEEEGYRCASELLGRRSPFTAILAANDMLALGALRALDEHGFRCPEDYSLVGFNDMPLVDRITPPLTTIRLPQYEAGSEAARLLLDRIRQRDGPVSAVLLAPKLVVRRSTCPPTPV